MRIQFLVMHVAGLENGCAQWSGWFVVSDHKDAKPVIIAENRVCDFL